MNERETKLPLTEAQQLAKIRDAIETALATESLRDSVVTREIADILGLPHGGPQPGNFVGRARKNLADKGYNCLKTPEGLHPNTVTLVLQFAGALAEKLKAAQDKYGYSDGWMDRSWMDECRTKLREHLQKGDPRDVAAYCAFLWHHGASTAIEQSEDAAPPSESERELLAKRLWKEATASGEGFCPPSWSGHWMDWYRLRADEIIARRNAEQAFRVVYRVVHPDRGMLRGLWTTGVYAKREDAERVVSETGYNGAYIIEEKVQ